MNLITKPDAEECLDRIEAWWDGHLTDRPPVTLNVRSDRRARDIAPPSGSWRRRKLDVDYVLHCAEAHVEAGVFRAETFPRFMPNLGPEICAAAYGCELEFSETTSWSVPCVGNIRDVAGLTPDLDCFYWSVIREMTDQSIARSNGRWITAITDLHTNGDLLAALRDPQALAMDFADDLPGVRDACRHVTPHASIFYDDLYQRIAAAGQPCTTWGIAISRRPMYYLSCDFICMISPAMFAETILPAIEWESRRLDRTIFHLDGPGALKHLDALLELPALHAVQWTYGAGAGRAGDWIEVYRRILAAGKGAEVQAADFDDARAVMNALPAKGIWLSLGGSHSADEADAFLAETARWARGMR